MGFVIHSEDELVDGSIYFSTNGNFGWTALPFIYEVFTRILRRLINYWMMGVLLMYCDDLLGISSKKDWRHDRLIAIDHLTRLFGENAHAKDKSDTTEAEGKVAREIVLLGWSINLSTNKVAVSRRNQLRAMRAFFIVDLGKPLGLQDRERLCSLAERYSTVFHELKVLMGTMYRMLGAQERVRGDQPIPLTRSSVAAIRIWRMILLASEYDYAQGYDHGRDILFFAPSSVCSCTIEYDGSPYGVGWRLFKGDDVECGYAGAAPLSLAFFPDNQFKSDYQNSCELTALVCGLVHLIHLGYRDCSIVVRGDSNTVCHWTEKDRFRSELAVAPTILFIALCDTYRVHIRRGEHIGKELNTVCDDLSRLVFDSGRVISGCGPHGVVLPTQLGLVNQALRCCSLDQLVDSETAYVRLWQAAKNLCMDTAGPL